MKKGKLTTKILIWGGLCSILILGIVWALASYKRPLGPALDPISLSEPVASEVPITEVPAATVISQATDLVKPTPPSITTMIVPTATSSPTSIPIEVCGETAVWNVLVLGSDAADLEYPQGSDLTRVVHVDFQNKTVSIFAFSRDLWVDASNLELTNPIITETRLGMVFYEARVRSTEVDPQASMLDGINAIAKTLASNFGINNNHYVALDLDKFPAMIDAIGGVNINIPVGFTDPNSGMAFQAGEQTLNGEQTAIYARAFLDTDLNRIERNNLLVLALRQKLLNPATWARIPELLVQFKDVITTDFSPEQLNHLVCLMKEVQTEVIIQEGVKAEWTSPGPEGSLLWDKMSVVNRLKELGMIP